MIMSDNIAILAAWVFYSDDKSYYTNKSHSVYVKEIARYCGNLCLIVPVKKLSYAPLNLTKLDADNFEVIELPYFSTYAGGMRNLPSILKAILQAKKEYKRFYARVPDPFCWLPWLLRCENVTMHFVGDSMHATLNSTSPFWIKMSKLLLYFPEYIVTLIAAKFCKVYVNGRPLFEKLRRFGIESTVVISSTITEESFFYQKVAYDSRRPIRLLYVGYLRPSKGVEKIINCLPYLDENNIDYHVDIVGDGESKERLLQLVDISKTMGKVKFHGHIDSPEHMQDLYNMADIFVFMSTSEGSPRVVLEAMAAQNVVISTRVGSLPYVFNHEGDILFVDHSSKKLAEKIVYAVNDFKRCRGFAILGQKKVKDLFLLPIFIRKVFFNET
jgi:glycosyltransferase involved in cell wall biosynthesis